MSCSMLALNAPMLRSVESLKPQYAACKSMRPSTLGVRVGMRRPSRGGLGRVKASATYDTEGNISNSLGGDVVLVTPFMNYNGKEDPSKPYPVEIHNKYNASFRQLSDRTDTSAAGLAYRALDDEQDYVNVIIAWKNSPQDKRVYTTIDDSNKAIDWTAIKAKLDTGGDKDTSKHRGVTSSIEWIYSSEPYIKVRFQRASSYS